MPGHEPHDPFRRHRYPHALRLQVEPLVSIPAFAVPGAPRARVPAAARPCWDVSWRELVVVRAARDAHHGQQVFRGWSGFPGLRPAFPNSSNVPRRIAISMSSSFFSRRCRSPLASSLSRRACIFTSLPSIAMPARPPGRVPRSGCGHRYGIRRHGPHVGFSFLAVVGFFLGVCITDVSLNPASIYRFQFLATDGSTPSPAAASRDFNRPDATAATASLFSSAGTGPCLSLRRPDASSSIHAMSSFPCSSGSRVSAWCG